MNLMAFFYCQTTANLQSHSQTNFTALRARVSIDTGEANVIAKLPPSTKTINPYQTSWLPQLNPDSQYSSFASGKVFFFPIRLLPVTCYDVSRLW